MSLVISKWWFEIVSWDVFGLRFSESPAYEEETHENKGALNDEATPVSATLRFALSITTPRLQIQEERPLHVLAAKGKLILSRCSCKHHRSG